MDMPFADKESAPDFGSIKMVYAGDRVFGYDADSLTDNAGNAIEMRVRKYVLLSEDISKLDLINNAADGSKAIIADTSKVKIFSDGEWRDWESSSGSGDSSIIEDAMRWGDI